MRGSVGRIGDGAEELRADSVAPSPDASPTDMWMLLIVRMITRVAHFDDGPLEDGEDEANVSEDKKALILYSRQDNLRQMLCDYIMADFPSRYVLYCHKSWLLTAKKAEPCHDVDE